MKAFKNTVLKKLTVLAIIAAVAAAPLTCFAATLLPLPTTPFTVNPFSSAFNFSATQNVLKSAVPVINAPAYKGTRFTKNLVYNNETLEVAVLTTALNYLGYPVKVGTFYNTDVVNAVKAFQNDNGLAVNGSFLPPTRSKMEALLKQYNVGVPLASTTLNVPAPPTDKDWIIIDKSANLLYHMLGNSVVHIYGCATGATTALTPEGKFKIIIKAVNPSWGGDGYAQPIAGGLPNNPLGTRWMGLDKGGGGQYGIHGTDAPSSIGTYASHGCVRMNTAENEQLFPLIPVGTPVWIGRRALLQSYGVEYAETLDGVAYK